MTAEAPDILYDGDGTPTAVRVSAKVNTAKIAVRVVAEEVPWLGDDFPCRDIFDDGSVYRPVLSEYRELVESVKKGAWRPFDPEIDSEHDSEWGTDSWWNCSPKVPGSVLYWDVRH